MDRNSIKSRLSEYLHLKGIKISDSGFINCPWHDDKNPSCKVNEDYAYCYSCGESGDIFKVAAAMLGVPCDKEHFREIANDVEQTLGIPEWSPPKRQGKSYIKLSESVVFKNSLLRDFADAINVIDLERALDRAYLLFALYLLPEGKKPNVAEEMAANLVRGQNERK